MLTRRALLALVGTLPFLKGLTAAERRASTQSAAPHYIRAEMRRIRDLWKAETGRYPSRYVLGERAARQYEAELLMYERIAANNLPQHTAQQFYFGHARVDWDASLPLWAISARA
jgi:hypothetical protein